MPDVREAFEAATAPPEPGASERQNQRQRRAVRRRRVGAFTVAAAISLRIGVIAFGDFSRDGGAPQIADDPIVDPQAPEDDTFLVTISDGALTPFPSPVDGWSYRFSPDGSQVAFTALEWDTDQQTFLMNADGTGMTTVTGTGFAYEFAIDVDEPVWSPDGEWLVITGTDVDTGDVSSRGRGLYFVSPDGHVPPRSGIGYGTQGEPTWSPDGREIAFTAMGREGPEIRIVRTKRNAGGKSITTVGRPETFLERASSFSWSPDGTTVVFVASDTRLVSIAGADGRDARPIADAPSANPSWSPDGATIAYDDLSSGRIAIYDVESDDTRYLDVDACTQGWVNDSTLLVTTECER